MPHPRSASARRLGLVLALLLVLVAGGCSGGGGDAAPTPAPVDPLTREARNEGSVGVIVQLAVPPERPGVWNRREVAREVQKLVDYLGPGATVVMRYAEVPQVELTVTPAALRKLRTYPKVTTISLKQD